MPRWETRRPKIETARECPTANLCFGLQQVRLGNIVGFGSCPEHQPPINSTNGREAVAHRGDPCGAYTHEQLVLQQRHNDQGGLKVECVLDSPTYEKQSRQLWWQRTEDRTPVLVIAAEGLAFDTVVGFLDERFEPDGKSCNASLLKSAALRRVISHPSMQTAAVVCLALTRRLTSYRLSCMPLIFRGR